MRLDDGSERLVDHAILATGFRVDVSRYRFLSPEVLEQLQIVNGYPVLKRGALNLLLMDCTSSESRLPGVLDRFLDLFREPSLLRMNWSASYVRSIKKCKVEAVFTHEDPSPGMAEILLVPYLAFKRGF